MTWLELLAASIVGGILNRLRGGLLDNIMGWKQRSTLQRIAYAVPTGGFMYLMVGGPLWLLPILMLSTFAGLTLGHGAHMVYLDRAGTDEWVKHAKMTEATTFWLPLVFHDLPQASWPLWRVWLYSAIGMGFIGLLRCSLTVLPLFWFHPVQASVYAASGLLLGAVYWLGQRIRDGETSEVLAGAYHWAALYILLRGLHA